VATVAVEARPSEVAITPNGGFVYVVNLLSDSVSVISTANNAVTATIPVGSAPTAVAITGNGAFAYVTNANFSNVSVINTSTNAVVITLPVGTTPMDVAITPTATSPEIACSGFSAPFDQPVALKKKVNRAIPLKIQLTDGSGSIITDQSIVARPVVNVLFNGQVFGTVPPDDSELLPPGVANEENIFRYDAASSQWVYNLGTKQFGATGIYEVTVAGGDDSEYILTAVNGACGQIFQRLP
jgi:YVTN family beta-propeller protein